MTAAFVLGNGVSRLAVDLPALKNHGGVYGCNAVYREFVPDVLISTDRGIATHIQNSGYSQQHVMYTRKPLPGLGARTVPQQYFGFSSGPIALALAAIDGHQVIYLIGFDMGPVANNRFNNVYADTEFYKKSNSAPTFTGNWIRQCVTVCRDFPTVSFHRVCGDTTAAVPELDAVPNMNHMHMTDFVDRLNSTKDL